MPTVQRTRCGFFFDDSMDGWRRLVGSGLKVLLVGYDSEDQANAADQLLTGTDDRIIDKIDLHCYSDGQCVMYYRLKDSATVPEVLAMTTRLAKGAKPMMAASGGFDLHAQTTITKPFGLGHSVIG